MSEYKAKTEQELKKALTDKQSALRVFRFGTSGSKNRNVKEAHNLRKDIARIYTEMNARARSAASL